LIHYYIPVSIVSRSPTVALALTRRAEDGDDTDMP